MTIYSCSRTIQPWSNGAEGRTKKRELWAVENSKEEEEEEEKEVMSIRAREGLDS